MEKLRLPSKKKTVKRSIVNYTKMLFRTKGMNRYSDCSGLTSLEIPSSVTSIGDDAFSGCSGLTSIYVSWNTPLGISSDVFDKVDKKSCILYIPKGTYQEYWLSNWGDFENIIEYDPTGIDNSFFIFHSSLKKGCISKAKPVIQPLYFQLLCDILLRFHGLDNNSCSMDARNVVRYF